MTYIIYVTFTLFASKLSWLHTNIHKINICRRYKQKHAFFDFYMCKIRLANKIWLLHLSVVLRCFYSINIFKTFGLVALSFHKRLALAGRKRHLNTWAMFVINHHRESLSLEGGFRFNLDLIVYSSLIFVHIKLQWNIKSIKLEQNHSSKSYKIIYIQYNCILQTNSKYQKVKSSRRIWINW